MKNKFIYIMLFLSLFVLGIPSLNATEDDWLFYCEYNVIWYKSPSITFPLKVEVYKDGSTKFYSNNKELNNGIFMKDFTENLGVYVLSYDANDFYSKSTNNNNLDCPNITLYKGDPNGRVELIFGDWSISNEEYISAIKETDKPIINPNLSEEEQGEIGSNVVTLIDRGCNTLYYDASSDYLNGYEVSFGITTELYSDGAKKISVKNMENDQAATLPYDNDNGNYFNIGAYSVFIPGGEEDLWFGDTCPVDTSAVICENEKGNSRYGDILMFSLNRNNVNDLCIFQDETASATETKPILGNLNKPLISSDKGFCVNYLGSVNNDKYELADLLDQIYTLIKIGSIILVIVLSMLEFTSATVKSKDELMATVRKMVTRLIILVVILLLPTFIDMVGNLFGIEDILCGIK